MVAVRSNGQRQRHRKFFKHCCNDWRELCPSNDNALSKLGRNQIRKMVSYCSRNAERHSSSICKCLFCFTLFDVCSQFSSHFRRQTCIKASGCPQVGPKSFLSASSRRFCGQNGVWSQPKQATPSSTSYTPCPKISFPFLAGIFGLGLAPPLVTIAIAF